MKLLVNNTKQAVIFSRADGGTFKLMPKGMRGDRKQLSEVAVMRDDVQRMLATGKVLLATPGDAAKPKPAVKAVPKPAAPTRVAAPAPEPETAPEPEPVEEKLDTPAEPEPASYAELPDGWEQSNKGELQAHCLDRELDDSGTKAELLARLQAWQDGH